MPRPGASEWGNSEWGADDSAVLGGWVIVAPGSPVWTPTGAGVEAATGDTGGLSEWGTAEWGGGSTLGGSVWSLVQPGASPWAKI